MSQTITLPARWCAPTPTSPALVPSPQAAQTALTPPVSFCEPTSSRPVVDLRRLEVVLTEALNTFGYHLPCTQTSELDRLTAFVRAERAWWRLASHLVSYQDLPEYRKVLSYARARWVNTWSAVGIEQIFATHPRVWPNSRWRDKLVDFVVDGVALDLKVTVFPARYDGDWELTKRNPEHLIQWLYKNQGRGHRYHTGNRLFIVLYDAGGEHWRLKAELTLIGRAVEQWLAKPQLRRVYLVGIGSVRSNILFVER